MKYNLSQDLENDNQTDLHQSKSTTSSSTLSHLLCPLCQSQFTQRANLEQHIIDIHKVSREGVERLMTIVDSVKENNVQTVNTVNNSLNSKSTNLTQLNNSLNSNHSGGLNDLDSIDYDEQETATEPLRANNNTDRHLHKFRCTQCPLSFRTADKLAIHSQYHKIREASKCVFCGKTTRTIESMQKHMETCHKEMNEQELDAYRLSLVNNPLLLSLKNGCQGVLDPSTTEMLKRESNREFDSLSGKFENGIKQADIDSLNDEDGMDDDDNDSNNNENSLLEDADEHQQDEELLMDCNLNQSNSSSLLNNSINNLAPNDEYLNSQGNAEDGYNDPTRKYKCHRCRVAYTRQSYLSAHNKTLYHRKGEKLTYPMEKYLDPNRPYKCNLCKESFTQKNILMTHYNSVSHLHRQNQAMKEMSNQTNSALSEQHSINSSPPMDSIDEPFKCNICKVSFKNNLALDNHVQSVQHQSRTSKLPQLAISGQIDLNRPLVERPNDSNQDDQQPNSNLSLINEQLQLLQQLNAANQQRQTNSNNNSQPSLNLNCQHCSSVFDNQDALNQHQQICFLINVASGNKQHSSSQLQQQSQLNNNLDQPQQQLLQSNKFYNASLCKSGKPVYRDLLETWGYEIVQQFNELDQRGKKQTAKLDEDGNEVESNESEINEEAMVIDEQPSTSEQHDQNEESVAENDEQSMASDEKAAESSETEVATTSETTTTTNENDAINKETLKLILESQEDDQEEKKENDPNTNNNVVTDANKSKCDTCMKEFSSIWILKAHKEEVHKDVVKMQTVQDFAEIYRKEFERKNSIVVKSVVLENDNNSNQLANLTQPQRPPSSQSNSSQNNSTATNSSSVTDQPLAQSIGDLNSSTNGVTKPANVSRSSQSTNSSRLDQSNELNNSTNSISVNSNNHNSSATSNSDASNLILNSPALSNPLVSANPLFGNSPLLGQAIASMMNQQQSTNTQNDVAQQMAQQLQMNQLLMSLSLANAMGSNQNSSANQPTPQQAIMGLVSQGLPPQMLPLLMANAAGVDPMMSILAAGANPLIAAAAAQNSLANASNPLAGLLSGISPEMLAANPLNPLASFLPGLAGNNLPNNNNLSKSPGLTNNILNNQTATQTTSNLNIPSSNTSLTSQSLQAQQAAQNAAAAAAAQSGKRARTRISDDQLKILRQYFDINNSPTEEALQEMAAKSQLPLKVIKHWFRNTLFKERQRNKDSPYNFNNPPSTYLNLEEYEKTGETKVQLIDENKNEQLNTKEENSQSSTTITPVPSNSGKTTPALSGQDVMNQSGQIKIESEITKSDCFNSSEDEEKSIKQENTSLHSQSMMESLAQQVQQQNDANSSLHQFLAAMAAQSQQQLLQSQLNGLGGLNETHQQILNQNSSNNNDQIMKASRTISPSEDSMDSIATNDTSSQPNMQIFSGMQFANLPGMPQLPNSLQLALQNSQLGTSANSTLGLLSGSNSNQSTPSATPNSNSANNNPGKRANRTRFTDYQIKVLQEFFESNAYPKDDDLEYLSKLLGLSPRVIVVWFQNSRQKARKVYENQPPSLNDATGSSSMPPASTTPNTNNNLTPCTTPNSATSSNSATPNPLGSTTNNSSGAKSQQFSYDCRKCLQSFQRYYELIKHMKSSCFKDENPVTVNSKGINKQQEDLNNSMSSNDFNQSNNTSTNSQAAIQNGTFQCDKCSMSFNRLDLFNEHKFAHIMNPNIFANLQQANLQSQFESLLAQQPSASPSLATVKSPSTTPLPNLFGSNQLDLNNQSGSSTSPTPQHQAYMLLQQLQLQQQQQQQQQQQVSVNQMNKRKYSNDDDDDSQSGGDGSQCSGNGGRSAANSRDKRLRTTILPEQLDFLMQKYNLESNPSRKMLESISEEVGLKKRVVQVWFQNQRARFRKNLMKPQQQMIQKRCPFCRALFRARQALESHLATRHADQYTRGEIDIDALPDSESGDEESAPSALNALNSLGLSGIDNGDNSNLTNGNLNSNPLNSLFGNNLLNPSGNDLTQFLQNASLNNGNNVEMADQLRHLLSNIPNLRDLMGNLSNGNEEQEEENDSAINNNNNESSKIKVNLHSISPSHCKDNKNALYDGIHDLSDHS